MSKNCPKCNAEMTDEAAFCTECGTKLDEVVEATEEATVEEAEETTEDATVEAVEKAVEETTEEVVEEAVDEVVDETVEAVAEAAAEQVQEEATEPTPEATPVVEDAAADDKKKKTRNIIIGVVAAVVVVIALVFVFSKFGGSDKSNSKQVAMLKGDSLRYTANMTKKNADVREICEIDSEYGIDACNATFSKDGKYLYFMNDIKEDGEGDLCRIKTSKISKKSDKNEKNIEEVSSKVRCDSFYMVGDSDVCYVSDEELCYSNGKSETKLAEDVASNWFTEDGVYLLIEDDDEYELQYCELKKNAKPVDIDDDVYQIVNTTEDSVYYMKDYKDSKGDVYKSSAKGKTKKLVEDVSNVYGIDYEKGTFYYTVSDEVEKKAIDFVDVKDASADKKDKEKKEPEKKDFVKEISEDEAIAVFEEEYYEIEEEFGSVAEFYETIKNECYSDEDMVDYGYNVFYSYVDGNEFYYYWNEDKNQWYEYDYDGYYDASSDFTSSANEAKAREDLIDDLGKEKIKLNVYSLNYFDGSKSTAVAENLANVVSADKNGVVYKKADVDSIKKIKLNDIYWASDVQYKVEDQLYYSDDADTYFCVVGKGKESELKGVENINKIDISEDGKTMMISCDKGLFSVAMSKTAGKAKKVEKDAYGFFFVDNDFYYAVSDDGDVDIYKWTNGKSTQIAKNVKNAGSFLVGDDGKGACISDGDLKVYDKKNQKGQRIEKDVYRFTYLAHNKILFLGDDGLYYYGGKDPVRIAKNIDSYVYDGESNGTWLNNYNYGYSYYY